MVKTLTERQLRIAAWLISTAAVITAITAWYQSYGIRLNEVSVYQFFPIFGLIAYSLMWSHYIAAVLRLHSGLDKQVLYKYFEVTSAIVLVAILLHPGLVSWQLWKDGLGLPPFSEFRYVGSALTAYIVIAVISLCVFLLYEFRRKFAERSWWKYVSFASDGAMLLIFLHALKLGATLQSSWFKAVWWFYGVTLVLSIIYIYADKYRQDRIPSKSR